MKFKRYLNNFNHFITLTFMLVISIIILPFAAFSTEDSYQLTKILQLDHRLIIQPNWQQLIANPSNEQQHFIIRESGQVYLVNNDKIEPQAILDMSVYQPTESSLLKLTAIELHPNFSLRGQVGYDTFYTAHLETINKKIKTKRLQERGDNLQLNFDAVITEWKFSAINHRKVDVNTKREVLRIGVPDKFMVIKQISFNSYLKSWNDDFGLLYIALNGGGKWPQPLYSGVILRINPTKSGLHSFSLPNNNPYMKNSQINNTIYLLGGQRIAKFIWPSKNTDHILVSHQYDNKQLLSLIDGQNDWRDARSKQVFYQSDNAVYDMVMYHGQDLPLLRSKLLLLRQDQQRWFVDSLAFDFSDNQKIRNEKKPQLERPITSQQLPSNSQIILSSNRYGEVLLLEKTINILFRLTQQGLANEYVVLDNDESNVIEKNSSNNSLLILLIVIVLIGIIYYWFRRNKYSVKRIVRKQFAALELSKSGQQISLYQRHQKNAETIIDIVDIVSSEIKLNEHIISVVNAQFDHGFNHNKEQDLRTTFVNEKVSKMIDGKIRQISLLLTDKQKNCYTVCLYMRKGSDRITKKSYVKVINELIDWCWLIGTTINADNTNKSKVKPTVLPKEKIDIISTKNDKAPLQNQAAAIRAPTHKTNNVSQSLAATQLSPTLTIVNENQQKKTIDIEAVYALDKLVSLRQQGFLTVDEFSKAKEKLLKGLFEK